MLTCRFQIKNLYKKTNQKIKLDISIYNDIEFKID